MDIADEEKKLSPAPSEKVCDCAGCGAGQPLYTKDGLVFCFSHRDWPNSKEGRKLVATRKIDKE
jgi:hypothetical protein